MAEITDEYMRDMMGKTRTYSVVLLRRAAQYHRPDAPAIIWEHGRRNFALRAEGVLAVVCPVADDTDLAGVGIFDATPEETARIMDGDPAVAAGVLSYEVHPVRSFPGDALPPQGLPGVRWTWIWRGSRRPGRSWTRCSGTARSSSATGYRLRSGVTCW